MSSFLPPSARVASRSVLSAAQHTTTRHAVWFGAAAIITDQVGQALLVHPTYSKDDSWLLPGGVAEPGKRPHVTCGREITDELGLDLPLPAVLAVPSFSAHHPDLQPGTTCPGEAWFVFDCGSPPAKWKRSAFRGRNCPSTPSPLAAETARERWGLPTARTAAIEEIPAEGMRLS